MSNEKMKREFLKSQIKNKNPKEKRAINERDQSFYCKKQYDFEKKRYGRSLLRERLK